MKKTILSIILTLGSLVAVAQAWFPAPTPPESLPLGRPRANFIVEHYWDHCPWKSAFSAPAKMEASLRDFAELLPLAQADTAYLGIDRLIDAVKKRPDDLQRLLQMAQTNFYSDTTSLRSPQVYLPFAKAGAECKKFSKEQRHHYAAQVQVIENSLPGAALPPLKATLEDGSTISLNDSTPGVASYILYFEQPGQDRINRTLFAANISVMKLVEAGIVKPMLIYAGEPQADWWTTVPAGWTAMALPQAADRFDLSISPAVYLVDETMHIVSPLMPLRVLTLNCENLVRQLGL